MEDYSYLDKKYFIDEYTYNCPFCNRKNVPYDVKKSFSFNWTDQKNCYGFLIQCSFCEKISMHLSYEKLTGYSTRGLAMQVEKEADIDSKIFYSVPTSFFVLDNRIPGVVRELITEAEGCLKVNYLTGASACTRKAIYELLGIEQPSGSNYDERIKNLKKKHPDIDPSYFDVLSHIQGMTSDKIHEQSWPKWNSPTLKLIIETLKSVLYEIYVLPKVKAARSKTIQQLQEKIKTSKKTKKNQENHHDPT